MALISLTNGTLADADDVSTNFNKTITHRKIMTITGDTVVAGDGVKDIGSDTIDAVAGSLIKGINIKCNIASSGTYNTNLFLKFTGSTLPTTYLAGESVYYRRSTGGDGSTMGVVLSTSANYLFSNEISGGWDFSCMPSLIFKLLDATTTVTVQAETSGGTGTIGTTTIEILYVEDFAED